MIVFHAFEVLTVAESDNRSLSYKMLVCIIHTQRPITTWHERSSHVIAFHAVEVLTVAESDNRALSCKMFVCIIHT